MLMREILFLLVGSLVVLFVAGCMHCEYHGDSFPATDNVKIYEDATKISESFTVIGKYVCSGRYNHFSREELYRRVVVEAEQKGADGALVRAYQIVPTGIVSDNLLSEDAVSVWAEDRGGVSSWGGLAKDFDGGYGSIGKKEAKSEPLSYTRIVRADFFKFNSNLSPDFEKKFESPVAAPEKNKTNASEKSREETSSEVNVSSNSR